MIDYYVPGDVVDETTVTSVTGSREQTPAMPNGRHGASIVITDPSGNTVRKMNVPLTQVSSEQSGR